MTVNSTSAPGKTRSFFYPEYPLFVTVTINTIISSHTISKDKSRTFKLLMAKLWGVFRSQHITSILTLTQSLHEHKFHLQHSICTKSNGQENASVLTGFDTVTGVGIPVWSTSVFHFVHSRDPYWQDALRFSSITSHWSLILYEYTNKSWLSWDMQSKRAR